MAEAKFLFIGIGIIGIGAIAMHLFSARPGVVGAAVPVAVTSPPNNQPPWGAIIAGAGSAFGSVYSAIDSGS